MLSVLHLREPASADMGTAVASAERPGTLFAVLCRSNLHVVPVSEFAMLG